MGKDRGFVPFPLSEMTTTPRKYDVSISLYGIEGRLLATIREGLINLVPANVDISISSDETTQKEVQLPIVGNWDVANMLMERGLLDASLRPDFVKVMDQEQFMVSRSEDV